MKEIERKVDEFLKGFYGDPETPCYRSPFSEELELNLQAGIVKLIESLSVEPKAESVDSENVLVNAKALKEAIQFMCNHGVTDGGTFATPDWFIDVAHSDCYGTPLMNSGDKDKVNE